MIERQAEPMPTYRHTCRRIYVHTQHNLRTVLTKGYLGQLSKNAFSNRAFKAFVYGLSSSDFGSSLFSLCPCTHCVFRATLKSTATSRGTSFILCAQRGVKSFKTSETCSIKITRGWTLFLTAKMLKVGLQICWICLLWCYRCWHNSPMCTQTVGISRIA